MIIAGIVIYMHPDCSHPDCSDLEISGICEICRIYSDKFAGVVEGISVGDVEKKVDKIRKMPGVHNVFYAYMNFEEDYKIIYKNK